MADAGYDVWLPNNRGNFYSRQHLFKNPDDLISEYWNFSWDDIAFQDFPCIFNYIQSVTNQNKFYYVAASQGTSSIMALLSEYPIWNDYLFAITLMCPIGFLSNAKLLHLLALLLSPLVDGVWSKNMINITIIKFDLI